jgi:hypothetical protein
MRFRELNGSNMVETDLKSVVERLYAAPDMSTGVIATGANMTTARVSRFCHVLHGSNFAALVQGCQSLCQVKICLSCRQNRS